MSADNAKTVEETLRKIIIKILHNDNVSITPATTFKDVGADSLDVIKTIVALEETYNIELREEVLKNIIDIGGLITYVKERIAAKK